jgi:hypothetical protein
MEKSATDSSTAGLRSEDLWDEWACEYLETLSFVVRFFQ